MVCLGGRDKNRHTQKKRADDQKVGGRRRAIDRWLRKTEGKDNQKNAACVADSLLSTTRRVGLLNVHGLQHGARVVGGMHRPHNKDERAAGFMVSTSTGAGGGG